MKDIAKCPGLSADGCPCPQRETCLRWTMPADRRWQSWAAFSYEGGCSAYLQTSVRREAAEA